MGDVAPDGVWIDLATQRVVTSRPVDAIQLVPRGGVIPDRVAQLLADRPVETAVAPPVETPEDEPDERTLLLARADAEGVTVDRRWGFAARLRKALGG